MGENDPTRILAIGSYDLLPVLNSHLFLCDGTFDVTPLVFFQLYTIHCPVGNNYPPFIYFLLPNKSQQTYRGMMQIVKQLISTANLLKVLTDFELIAINAFREEFPEAELSGCYFRLSQSIVRKVGELGLKNQFENDQNFNLLVKSLAALSFVPIEDVNEVFARLAEQFPQNEACEDLLAYFEANYIRGQQIGNRIRNPRFPPTLWNHFTDALGCAPKTPNCCEGFHNAFLTRHVSSSPSYCLRFFEGYGAHSVKDEPGECPKS